MATSVKEGTQKIWLPVLNNSRDLLRKLFYNYVYLLLKNFYKISYVTFNNTLLS